MSNLPCLLSSAGESTGEVVLVAFLGGCTYAELSALRHLGASPAAHGTQFLALTTKVRNSLHQAIRCNFIDAAAWMCVGMWFGTEAGAGAAASMDAGIGIHINEKPWP